MTIFAGPYSTGNMNQAQWEEVESKLWSDGVIAGARNAFVTTTTSGLGISVNTGDAMLDGFRCYADAATALTAATADPSLPRIDLLVFRIDESAHTSTIALKTGTPASSPVAPTATQTVGGTYELPLYQVRVNAASSTITSLTDVRTYCAPGSAVNKTGDTMTGALTISEALAGSNKSYVSFVASDGKTYRIQITTGGAIQIFNATDSATVAVFGPAAGTMWAGPTPGSQVWHAGNDGSGSGLDADTVDGQHASAFLGVAAKAADSDKLDAIDSTGFAQTGANNAITPLKISAGTVLPGTLDSREIFILLA